ncbi:hypothetical protein FRB94_001535 [Tulasnella sp. JGI-2019a]|nr:hypothetical protein FRB93_012500 [Tulasnella sp. JGI-2019a]KAG9005450.1 hypothetical protein FRB94_001535 [Tulasnella sp. JGI-2019a]
MRSATYAIAFVGSYATCLFATPIPWRLPEPLGRFVFTEKPIAPDLKIINSATEDAIRVIETVGNELPTETQFGVIFKAQQLINDYGKVASVTSGIKSTQNYIDGALKVYEGRL